MAAFYTFAVDLFRYNVTYLWVIIILLQFSVVLVTPLSLDRVRMQIMKLGEQQQRVMGTS